MLTRPEEKISRSFKRDFPEFVAQIEQLDLRVQTHGRKRVNDMPTYILEGCYQLTGYKTANGNEPFTKEMAKTLIQKLLNSIVEARAEVAELTREQRFRNVIAGMKTIELRYGNFCSYGHHSGDTGTILFNSTLIGWVRLWDEEKDCAHAEYYQIEQLYDALAVSFRNGGATIAFKDGRAAQRRAIVREFNNWAPPALADTEERQSGEKAMRRHGTSSPVRDSQPTEGEAGPCSPKPSDESAS